jgi:hypothetical protein
MKGLQSTSSEVRFPGTQGHECNYVILTCLQMQQRDNMPAHCMISVGVR